MRMEAGFAKTSGLWHIPNSEVQVWPVDLDAADTFLGFAVECLSEAERKRMMAFRFERLAQRYAMSHAVLRILLARYSGVGVRELAFQAGAHGKPMLASPANLFFNISDAAGFGLYAFSLESDIGIDLEQVKPVTGDLEALARFVLSPGELSTFFSLLPRDRLHAFLRYWTRKEACVKAAGYGLSIAVDTLECAENGPCQIGGAASPNLNTYLWALHDLAPAQGYVGALACTDASKTVQLFDPVPASTILCNAQDLI